MGGSFAGWLGRLDELVAVIGSRFGGMDIAIAASRASDWTRQTSAPAQFGADNAPFIGWRQLSVRAFRMGR